MSLSCVSISFPPAPSVVLLQTRSKHCCKLTVPILLPTQKARTRGAIGTWYAHPGQRVPGAVSGFVHEDRPDQIDNPSIAYWRLHSAGASRRRVTPIPRGSFPSMAAFTSEGARNASEIVIWICRTLHFS